MVKRRLFDDELHAQFDYMHLNPVRAGLVKQACDWRWSSARYYERMNEPLHPFRWLPSRPRKIAFLLALIGTLVVMCALGLLGRGLETGSAPSGIVSFEFAGDLATAARILDCWGESGRVITGFHLGLDYLFLVLYASFIALGCALAIAHLSPKHGVLVRLGVWLAWGQLLAGLLDAVENLALFSLLLGVHHNQLPRVAWWCAAGKFALVAVGLVFLLLASVLAIIAHVRKPKGNS